MQARGVAGRRAVRIVVAAASVLALFVVDAAVVSPPAAATPERVFSQACGGTSWWAGTTNVCNGSVVYRDYVNDDHGADAGARLRAARRTPSARSRTRRATGGTQPTGSASPTWWTSTLTRRGNQVDVVAETAALYRARRRRPHAGDRHRRQRPDAGGGAWGALGVRSAGWDRLVVINRGDPRTNTLRGSFPLPASSRWRVQAVTSDASTGAVMNVAFRGADEQAQYNLSYTAPSPYPPSGRGAWFEDKQAAALAAGDISAFGYTVSNGGPAGGVTRKATIAPGLHERVYTSAYTVPASRAADREHELRGRQGPRLGRRGPGVRAGLQPARQVPAVRRVRPPVDPGGRYGRRLEWHGSNQGIVAQINQPGMQQQFGEDLGRTAGHARGTRAERLRLRRQRARPARRHGRRGAHVPRRQRTRLLQRLLPGRLHHLPHGDALPRGVRRLHRLGGVHRRRHERPARPGHGGRRHGRRRRQHDRLRRQRPARTRAR